MPEIKSLLLTWDEYNQKEFSVPYVFKIEKPDKKLVYFGARHSFDASDDQFRQLDEEWNKFASFQSQKKIAIGEGGPRPLPENLLMGIKDHGEQGFLKCKASDAQIEVMYPDP